MKIGPIYEEAISMAIRYAKMLQSLGVKPILFYGKLRFGELHGPPRLFLAIRYEPVRLLKTERNCLPFVPISIQVKQ